MKVSLECFDSTVDRSFSSPAGRVLIKKKKNSDLKRENQVLSKEIWESILLISREKSVNQFVNWILRRMAYIESISEFGLRVVLPTFSFFKK